MTKLIHEKLSIVMTFCYSRKPLEELVESQFRGEWKYLRKALFDISEQHAEKACLELALFLRLLDDEEGMSSYLKKTSDPTFGRLIRDNKSEKALSLRYVCNKIIHASRLQWDFQTGANPLLICQSQEPQKWSRAEVDVVSLAALCGELMS